MPFKGKNALGWLAVLVLLGACRSDARESDEQAMQGMPGMAATPGQTPAENAVVFSAAQIQHGAVHWQAVAMETTTASAIVPGAIVPDEDRTARLGAPVQGRVMTVRVRPGDRVAPGQVLVTLHSPQVGMAQSDVDKAQAELAARRAQTAYAKSARERAERLLALKAIPQQDYERAVADDELARAAQAQAESELRRSISTAEQIGADSASGELALRAPLAGVVLSRSALPGAVVEAGAPLVSVTDASRLWLTVDAPEAFAQLLRVGTRITFAVPAFGQETFTARIAAVGAGLDPQTRTIPIRADIVNRDGRLRPEMLASVTIEAAHALPAVLLPADAVQVMGGKSVVFLATPDGKGGARFSARDVEVGPRSGVQVAVTRGLQAGEQVVTQGAFAVKAQLQKASMPKMEM